MRPQRRGHGLSHALELHAGARCGAYNLDSRPVDVHVINGSDPQFFLGCSVHCFAVVFTELS